MEHRGWTFELRQNPASKMQDYHIAVLCNINNNRRRKLRQWVAALANGDEEATMEDGSFLPLPDGGAVAPDAPEWL